MADWAVKLDAIMKQFEESDKTGYLKWISSLPWMHRTTTVPGGTTQPLAHPGTKGIPPTKSWSQSQTNEYLRRLKAQLDYQVKLRKELKAAEDKDYKDYATQEEADHYYKEAVSVINKYGFGSRELIGGDNFYFSELIGSEWKETLSWNSKPVEGLEGVVKLGDKYYYENGQLLAEPYQEAAGKYDQRKTPEELQGEMSKGWIEANELLAQRKQAYKDVQKEWSESLETPRVVAPGEAFSTDTTMRGRELGIPERIWSDPNFQKAYEQNLAKIKEAQTRPFQKYGTADAEAYAAVPESTNRASEQMALKRALEGYAPPAVYTKGIPPKISPPMGEDWVSHLTPKRRDEAAYAATQKKRAADSRERARYALARQKEQEGLDKFKGFMQYWSGITPDEEKRPPKRRETPGDYGLGAMSTAEQQALMGEYEEKYDVNAWPTLPSGQSWYTMPWEQRGNVMNALTTGWGSFGDDPYKSKIPYSPYKKAGAFGKKYGTPPKEWKPRYTSPEEALYFMNMAPYSSGLSTNRRAMKQRG